MFIKFITFFNIVKQYNEHYNLIVAEENIMKKKNLKLFVLSAVFAMGLSSCGFNPAPTPSEFELKTREIYQLAVEAGATTMTYEEWLDSIRGENGDNGLTPFIGENGHWWIGTTDTGVTAKGEQGDPGDPGKSAYEIYCEAHPEYTKSEAEWLDDLVNGRLGNQEYHTVTFDTGEGSEVPSQQVLHGEKATKPGNPTRDKYLFIDWVDENNDHWVFNGYPITSDITLTAVWELDTRKLVVSPETTSIYQTDEFDITCDVFPLDTTVSFVSSDTSVVTVSDAGHVIAVGGGEATVTVTGSHGLTATCEISVDPFNPNYYGVRRHLNYEGNLAVGITHSNPYYVSLIALIEDFNDITESNINFTFYDHDPSQLPDDPYHSQLDLFMVASDLLGDHYLNNTIIPISKEDSEWISQESAPGYKSATSINNVEYGYPLMIDTTMMYYNKSVFNNASEIDTLDKIIDVSNTNNTKVGFPYTNGFYASGILQTFTDGSPLYQVEYSNVGYTITSEYETEEGLSGAKVLKNIMNHNVFNSQTSIQDNTPICISYSSSSLAMSGSNIGIAPMPFVADGVRLGTLSEYIMFCLSSALSEDKVEMASALCRFLTSEYAQTRLLEAVDFIPTNANVQEAEDNPLVEAYLANKESKAVTSIEPVPSIVWNSLMTFAMDLKNSASSLTDEEYLEKLRTLDASILG